MKTSHTTRTMRILVILAVGLTMLLAAGAALADDEARMEKARKALNDRAYRRAAELYAEAYELSEHERTKAEAVYWQAFALYRTEKTYELQEALELLQYHAERFEDEATAAEAEALEARVLGELARRGQAGEAREVYERAERERQREETRVAALHALMQMDPDKALPIIEKIVRDDSKGPSELRRNALFMLCQVGGDEGVEILLDVLPTLEDPEMVHTAVICLGQSDSELAHQTLVTMARESDDPTVLQAVMITLGHSSNSADSFELLVGIARDKDRDPEVRSHAIIGLMQMEYEGTTDALLTIVRDRDEDDGVIETALMALSRLDDDAATDVLLDMARDGDLDDEMRAQALFMAGMHGHLEPGELQEIYQTAESHDLKVQICHVLSRLDDQEEAFDVMISILEQEKDPDIRSEAVFWIGQFDDPRAADYLMKVINDE